MALIALIFAVFVLFCCVYLWLELQKKPSSEKLRGELSAYSDELKKQYAAEMRAIETEWENMYQKFRVIVGRVDKTRGLEAAQNAVPVQAPPMTRSDLLRKHRSNGGEQHV